MIVEGVACGRVYKQYPHQHDDDVFMFLEQASVRSEHYSQSLHASHVKILMQVNLQSIEVSFQGGLQYSSQDAGCYQMII